MNLGSVFLVFIGAVFLYLLSPSKRSKGKRRGFSFLKRKKRKKKSWYLGNKRWRKIRARRVAENTKRYRLRKATCRCERCGSICKGRDIHCDHIYPRNPYWFLQYFYWNTQILCSKCNIKKSNKRDGHNWRLWRQLGLHPVAWFLRKRQEAKGIR